MGINEIVTAPRSPWQNAYVERIIGSIRRECLDHVVIFDERHLRRTLSSYVQYYHRTRTHLSLDKDCPQTRSISQPTGGKDYCVPRGRRPASSLRTTRRVTCFDNQTGGPVSNRGSVEQLPRSKRWHSMANALAPTS